MNEQEGVIKYRLNHKNLLINENISITNITIWRSILFDLNLIGQSQDRYNGYGFGNISQRLITDNDDQNQFLISGTQTGATKFLSRQQYCQVLEAYPHQNELYSAGEIEPSSESLTHSSIYQQNLNTQSIIHIHCPEIWNNTQALNLPYTSANIEYGTPEMAKEVERLLGTLKHHRKGIFSMLGHTDGIIAFSDAMDKTANLIISYYAKSLELGRRKI